MNRLNDEASFKLEMCAIRLRCLLVLRAQTEGTNETTTNGMGNATSKPEQPLLTVDSSSCPGLAPLDEDEDQEVDQEVE